MEQDLNNYKEFESDLCHIKLQYKNQNIDGNSEFQEWKRNAIEYIEGENKNTNGEQVLLIKFCDNCCSYSIFTLDLFSLIKCHNCKYEKCIGCNRQPLSNEDYLTCLKGFLIGSYYRAFYESIKIMVHEPILYIFHIIFSLIFTPSYIGYIFNMLGFLMHPNKSRLKNDGKIHDFTYNGSILLTIHIYSIIKGILFFPYVITFFPFIVLLLLPGIFSKVYYLKVFTFYFSLVMSGGVTLKDKHW